MESVWEIENDAFAISGTYEIVKHEHICQKLVIDCSIGKGVSCSVELQAGRLSPLFRTFHAISPAYQCGSESVSIVDTAKLPLSSLFPPSINEINYPNLTEFHISDISDTPKELQKMLASLPVSTKSVFISSTPIFGIPKIDVFFTEEEEQAEMKKNEEIRVQLDSLSVNGVFWSDV